MISLNHYLIITLSLASAELACGGTESVMGTLSALGTAIALGTESTLGVLQMARPLTYNNLIK